MRTLFLLCAACALWACSDSKPDVIKDAGSNPKPDAGEEWPDEKPDAAVAESPLGERPPGSLERPPADKLPDSLKPPGFQR
jgi:hypothetical protein